MSVSYKRLWHLLIDKDMKKKDLMEKANISDYTIRKLNRGDKRVIQNMLRYSGNEDGYGRLYAISVPKGQ